MFGIGKRIGRFEILLPLEYNDGSLVELEKFDTTRDELGNRFGGVTLDSIQVNGFWLDEETPYHDKLIRLRIDTVYSRKNKQIFRSYKEVLKERFLQEDIWITVHTIEIL